MFLFSQPPPLRISRTSNLVFLPLLEMDDWRAVSEVIPGISTGKGIYGVGARSCRPWWTRATDVGSPSFHLDLIFAPTGHLMMNVGMPVS